MSDLHEEAERLAQYLDAPGRGLVSYDAANTLRELSARLAEVEADLKSVLDREAATTARYDARLAEVERERDARVAAVVEEAASLMVEGRAYAVEEHGENSLIVHDMDARRDAILRRARPEETDALDRIRAEEREKGDYYEGIQEGIKIGIAEERERCAKVVDRIASNTISDPVRTISMKIAAAIREDKA